MCLYIRKGNKIEVADKPIFCYKIVTNYTEQEWEAFYQRTKHEYNKELVAIDSLLIDDCSKIPLVQNDEIISTQKIEFGFHAYQDKKSAEAIRKLVTGTIHEEDHSNSRVCPAIIPPGAEYCLGINGDIVANKMIVFSDDDKLKEYVAS